MRLALGGDIRARGGLLPIYETTAFRALSSPASDDRPACVIVEAVTRSIATDAALDRLFRAHREPTSPIIARALERTQNEQDSYVTFDIPATTDLESVIRFAVSASVRATHAETDGFILAIRDAILSNARAPLRPAEDRHLGTLAMSNVLFAPDGQFFLLGFGHNVAAHDEHGALVARSHFFRAPEIALGCPPTEQSDFVALLMLVRGMLEFVDLNDTVTRALHTNSILEDLEIVKHILFIESHVMHASPEERASVEQTMEISNRIRTLTGTRPDKEGFMARVSEVLEATFESTQTRRRDLLRVCPAGTYFDRGRGPRVDLSRCPMLGKILVVLATERIVRPGNTLDIPTLADAFSNGERIFLVPTPEGVSSTMASLARLGLGNDIELVNGGYRIAERVECFLVSS